MAPGRLKRAVTHLLCCLCLMAGCGKKERTEEKSAEKRVIAPTCLNEIKSVLREGDIVFRRGGGLVSRAVLIADTDGIYSHVGIAVRTGGAAEPERDNPGGGEECRIVHMVPGEPDENGVRDVIRMEKPDLFFAQARAVRGAVMRVKRGGGEGGGIGPGKSNNESVSVAAEEEADADTDTDTEVEIDAVAIGAAKRAAELAASGLAFDYGYDLADTTRMYCTEFVWRVFEREGLDLTGGRRTKIDMPGFRGAYIMPSDIAGSPDLELIYRF